MKMYLQIKNIHETFYVLMSIYFVEIIYCNLVVKLHISTIYLVSNNGPYYIDSHIADIAFLLSNTAGCKSLAS